MAEVQEAELVRDPVCGMMIEPQDAVSSQEFEGKTYHSTDRRTSSTSVRWTPRSTKWGRVPARSAAWRSNPPP